MRLNQEIQQNFYKWNRLCIRSATIFGSFFFSLIPTIVKFMDLWKSNSNIHKTFCSRFIYTTKDLLIRSTPILEFEVLKVTLKSLTSFNLEWGPQNHLSTSFTDTDLHTLTRPKTYIVLFSP